MTGISSAKGMVEFALYKNPAVFTQAGKYAVVVYHDENHNKICDKNFFGIPTEAYAFSNTRPQYRHQNGLLISPKNISICKSSGLPSFSITKLAKGRF